MSSRYLIGGLLLGVALLFSAGAHAQGYRITSSISSAISTPGVISRPAAPGQVTAWPSTGLAHETH